MNNESPSAETSVDPTGVTTSPPRSPVEILQDVMRILNRAGEDFSVHRRWLSASTYQSLNVEYGRLRNRASVVASNPSRNGVMRLQKEVDAFEQIVCDEICNVKDI